MIAAVSLLDWSIVVLSVVLISAAGTWFARRQSSSEQYFIGARSVPGWAAGLSLFASIISTITFIAYPEQGYAGNWTLLLPGLMLPIVVAFVSLAVVPFYRRFIRMSAYEYLEERFGYPVRAYAAGQFLLLNLFRYALVLFLSAKAIHTFTSWNVQALILICGVVTVVYTVSGGFQAVVWTDVLQSFVMLGGGIACVLVILFASDAGAGRALHLAWADGKFRLADLSWNLREPTILVTVFYGLFTYGGLYVTNQDSVQRYLATPTTRQARRGLWLGAICCMAIWTLFMLVGTLLYSYYKLYPDRLPANIAKEPMKVFPYFVMSRFPIGTIGLIISAMMAASMSTLSSTINSMSLVTICDFVRRPSRPLTDREELRLGRMVSIAWGVIGTLTGLSMIGIERALNFTYTITSIISGGLLGVFMLAFLVRRAGAAAIYAGIIAGMLLTAWGAIGELIKLQVAMPAAVRALKFPYHPWLIIGASNVASFVVGYAIALIAPRRDSIEAAGHTLWDLRSDDLEGNDLPGVEGQAGMSV